MRPKKIDGTELDATFSVEQDGAFLAIILESATGEKEGIPARNPDYREALTLLVSRLRELGAVIEDALVDSTRTRNLDEADRRVIHAPLALATAAADDKEIRLLLTRPQGRIGQRPGAKKDGNTTKRLRLRVTVPGYTAEKLEPVLAGTAESPIDTMLASLDRLNIQSTKRHQPLTLLWAIGRAVQGRERQVPWSEARGAIGSLMRDFGHPGDSHDNAHLPFLALNGNEFWELSASPPKKGPAGDLRLRWLNQTRPEITGGLTEERYRLFAESQPAVSSVVDRLLLAHFDGADEQPLLDAVGLGGAAQAVENHRRTYTGKLGYDLVVLRRGEQNALRRLLLGRSASRCALCGAELPERFLVAAHIKQRSECSEQERRDLDNVAMLACTLGCDSLYEHGYIGVADDGVIELSPHLVRHPHLHEHALRLTGRKVTAWTGSSKTYFDWHLSKVFRT
ncbi:hypothetical protein [Herbidospora sp. RD11066]